MVRSARLVAVDSDVAWMSIAAGASCAFVIPGTSGTSQLPYHGFQA
ncbi:hypothetical protein KBZ21_07995 [Streptomyces sp. A73]|nr:hypothetical protein [Streptomyces sp. B15]MBQ1122111.1 hypothetical protein [Streptomyces sp. B15]MBQ1158089.1 hypothetical protein [Streptomyces sp. A73]